MQWAMLFATAVTIASVRCSMGTRLAVNIVIGCCGAVLVQWYRKRRM
jgi:hypothetical protein